MPAVSAVFSWYGTFNRLATMINKAGRPMTQRENLFRPVHKGIRSMLYELGSRLQTTDFGNINDSNRFVERLKHDLGDSLSNCVLCLLRTHSNHEERDIFTRIKPLDPDLVELVMKEHAEVARRIRDVTRLCDEVIAVTSPARRIEVGDRLYEEANDLFAYYLGHLNNEETTLVPAMWERFTDAQLREIRTKFYDGLPLPLFETWLRWTLPSLNANELVVLYTGLKQPPRPDRYADWVRLARETLDLTRLQVLEDRVGLKADS
jgi:hypothetical protein